MTRVAQPVSLLLAFALFACSPSSEQQPVDIVESPLAGKAVCETSYTIAGREQFTPDQSDAIGDAVYARGGEFMKQLEREQAGSKLPDAVLLDYDRTLVSVVFTGACDLASDAQSRFLAFMHAEAPAQELPQGIRLELAAMTQKTMPATGPLPVGTMQ